MHIYWNDGTSLYHYGISGQKWGLRRFQNPDGTLTEEGKKRYGRISLGNKQKKLQSLSDKEFGNRYKKHQAMTIPAVIGAAAQNIGINVVNNIKYGGEYKNKKEKYIALGIQLVPALLYALDHPYQKELARRTGTKVYTFDKSQNAKKEKWLRDNGGYLPFQAKSYDKRSTK